MQGDSFSNGIAIATSRRAGYCATCLASICNAHHDRSSSHMVRYGKPALASAALRPEICFNLSHSHGLAVVAIGQEREVGIDVELIRAEFASEAIAKRYFSAKEIDELSGLPAELRTEGFFLCWTRKEAYIKAKGDGLQIPLDSFDVSLSPGRPATLSSVDEPRWGIESFVPSLVSERRFAAAVVAEGKDWIARYFEWKQPNGEEQLEE